ncbi:DUF3995 domain-containing protein [Myroides marinus]|uniref:DUF3995 domain-containing protein n=1 Tax=Myroides marinus TaxID=703342 RepID=UPI0007419569|nr:DUF3995 domain-containing protein [Myroides marinus]KUF43373.1 hypothetical protein AS361_10655 [Myroides marinus]MDM1347347.1 DUF3995 domain-containing protein [Myroides marinus]MDM1349667.1 DUF3995 domain-containing protein [Myroides marinus]MDM1354484.1 DUF3995 domain-containing protein [Myroides marinus]MDM1356876.1 DUF3995 domain-containing protein [Myroides marinus]
MSLVVVIKIVNVLIFSFLSGVHIYWAFGGKWATEGVLPTNDGVKKLNPSPIGTLVVATGLGLFAFISRVDLVEYRWGYLVLSILFGLRVIGDFRYVGLFKIVKNSVFARKDTAIFIPLCIYLSLSNAFLYFC